MASFGLFVNSPPDDENVCVLTFTGVLSEDAVDVVERFLAELEPSAPPVIVVDLQMVEFVYSGVLQVLARWRGRARYAGRQLLVFPGNERVAKAITIAGFGQTFASVDELEGVVDQPTITQLRAAMPQVLRPVPPRRD